MFDYNYNTQQRNHWLDHAAFCEGRISKAANDFQRAAIARMRDAALEEAIRYDARIALAPS